MIQNIFKVAYLDFFRRLSSFLKISIILSIGLSALYSTLSLKNQLIYHLEREAKFLLSSDLSINVRRAITEEEKSILEKSLLPYKYRVTREITLLSLVQMADIRNPFFPLSFNIKWVGKEYPFYSKSTFESSVDSSKCWRELHDGKFLYLNIEQAKRFNLKKNDTLIIFGEKYFIKDFFADNATLGSRFFSFFPTAYISIQNLEKNSKLLGPQTSFFETIHIKWDDALSSEEQNKIKILLEKELKDPALKISLPRDSSEQNQRLWETVTDFLGIITLCAILLSFLGLITLIQFQWNSEEEMHKRFFLLGFSKRERILLKFFQILFVSALGVIFSLFLSWPMTYGLMTLLPAELKILLKFWDFKSFYILSIYVVSLLVFVSFYFFKSDKLLHKNAHKKSTFRIIFTSLLVFVLVLLFGRFLIRSWFLSLLVSVVVIVLYCLLLGSVKVFLILLNHIFIMPRKISSSSNFNVLSRLIYSSWKKNYLIYSMTVGCLGLVYFLLIILLSLHSSLKYQFMFSKEKPDVFLFDVQTEDRKNLENVSQEFSGSNLKFYPMVRGRISLINGVPLVREARIENPTREEEEQSRFKFRSVNASYQTELSQYERILFGLPLPASVISSTQEVPISLENRYAKRLKVDLGDKIEFDFQGVKVKTFVQNIRYVHWLSLHPNFFIMFPSGILENIPQSYLAVVKFSKTSNLEGFLKKMMLEFNQISMLLLKQTADLVWKQLALLLKAFFLLSSLFVGLGLFLWFSVLDQRIQHEKSTIHLLFKLGLSLKQIRMVYLFEFVGSFLIIVLITPLLSYISARGIAHEFFDDLLIWPIGEIFFLTIILVLPMLVFTYVFVKRFCRLQ